MMEKHLEIFKHVEELYKDDVTDEEILNYAEKNSAKMEMWKQAFEGYLLRDVLDAIDIYFAKKNNRTPPRIAQIKAVLNTNNVRDEREVYQEYSEAIEPTFGLKFQQLDKENGDMHWFVQDYIEVENLIRADYWGWIYNIKNPTLDEFHRCIEEWCKETTGHKYRFYSDNDIANMTEEQKQALLEKCREKIRGFNVKTLN